MNSNRELFDSPAERRCPGVVDLHRHEARREFDDVGLETKRQKRVGRLEPQEAAADDRTTLGALGPVANGDEVVDRAVDEAPLGVVAVDGGHERVRPRGEHAEVVVERDPLLRHDLLFSRSTLAARSPMWSSMPDCSKKPASTSERSSADIPP